MDIKIEGFSDNSVNYMRTALNVRFDIFTKELNIDKFKEFDGLDKESTHYIIFVDMMPAGVCRWRKEKNHILIDRFGIKKEYRGMGYGILLLKYVVKELRQTKKDIQILSIKEGIAFFNFLGIKKNVEEVELYGKNLVKFSLVPSQKILKRDKY